MEMPTKEQILGAAEDCPQAKSVLKKLWPTIFEEQEPYRPRVGDIVKYIGNDTPRLIGQKGIVFNTRICDDSASVFWQNSPKYDTETVFNSNLKFIGHVE